MRIWLALSMLVAIGISTSGCVVRPARVYVAPAPGVVVVQPPPPLQAETVPPPPAASGYAWQPGHWRWNGAQYVWWPGRYELIPARATAWVPAHWDDRGGQWVFVPGHWAY
jgi:hypothetical protein